MENNSSYERAKKRVEGKIGFITHLVIYLVVIVLLIVINFMTSSGTFWVIWPMMGWGLAVIIHGLRAYVFSGRSMITEKMIQEEMEKEGK